MFYKQSITDIEVVVLTLDGGLLDLNRLRYNYYRRLCKHYDKSINRNSFTDSLGNMYTMYASSPIQENISNTELSELVEKDLFSYIKLKPNIYKDGIEELLQFFVQRDIRIVVVSTHKTKRAIQYLQLTRLYNYIDFVVGGDSDSEPLPSSEVLELISNQMQVSENHMLVIANFPSMVSAANKLLMNVVYIPDLVSASPTIEASVYRVAKNPLEIINLFLFAKYDTVEMFSPLLGMSAKMDVDTLQQTYEDLMEEYADDDGLLRLVKETYQYFLAEIGYHDVDQKEILPVDTKEELPVIEEEPVIEEIIEELEVVKEDNFLEEEPIEEMTVEIQVPTHEIGKNDALSRQKEFVTQATSLTSLMNDIEKKEVAEVTEEIESKSDAKEGVRIWDYIIDFLYTTMLSIVIVLVGMIGYVVMSDFLHAKGVVSSMVRSVVDGYILCIVMFYHLIFDGLHAIISFIPDYETLLTTSSFASRTGMETILYVIFHIILIYICKWIWTKIKSDYE
jgi:beta-phosphoglucomutase-like phosphatase (HAD superfamily)